MPRKPSTKTDPFTLERLRELLNYNPETGVFTWRLCRQGGSAKTGRAAGSTTNSGHIAITVDGKRFSAHRLEWLYMTGDFPAKIIDHINGVPSDNKWSNLRQVTAAMNAQNIKTAYSTNKSSGLLGVSFFKRTGRWQAQITVNNKPRGLGYFDTAEEAHEAYMVAKRKLHPGFVEPVVKKADLVSDWEKFI